MTFRQNPLFLFSFLFLTHNFELRCIFLLFSMFSNRLCEYNTEHIFMMSTIEIRCVIIEAFLTVKYTLSLHTHTHTHTHTDTHTYTHHHTIADYKWCYSVYPLFSNLLMKPCMFPMFSIIDIIFWLGCNAYGFWIKSPRHLMRGFPSHNRLCALVVTIVWHFAELLFQFWMGSAKEILSGAIGIADVSWSARLDNDVVEREENNEEGYVGREEYCSSMLSGNVGIKWCIHV